MVLLAYFLFHDSFEGCCDLPDRLGVYPRGNLCIDPLLRAVGGCMLGDWSKDSASRRPMASLFRCWPFLLDFAVGFSFDAFFKECVEFAHHIPLAQG